MPLIFLPGPLGAPEVVLALSAAQAGIARLDGYGVRIDADRLRVALVPEPGGRADGVVVEDAPQVRFVLEVMGGVDRAAEAETERGRLAVRAFAGDPGAVPWAEKWDGDFVGALAEAVPEVLAHQGRSAPGEVAGLMGPIADRAWTRRRAAASGRGPAGLRRGFSTGDVEAVSRGFGYARFFAVEDHVLRHRRFDGGMSPEIGRAVMASGDAVTVLPFDLSRGEVLLIEQFRTGPFARRDPSPWMLEAVAGRCDGAEPPGATARREAMEEAGVRLGRLRRIAGYYPTPGISAEYLTAFVGEADLAGAGGVHGLAAEDEDIRVLVVPVAEALRAVESGEVNNAPLLMSLLWLARNHEALAAEWSGG